MPIIQTENLTHTYSVGTPFQFDALKNINLSIERGEFIGIIGHTGSGKSTLIQHLNGLLQATEGKVLFDGTDIFEDKKKIRNVRFKVGLVFQYPEYQLFEETVYKDIAFGPKNMGLSLEEIDERVRVAARFVNIPDNMLEKSPLELSGGQKRRVAIAGVLAMEPEVLILDEPSAGLDPVGREQILSQIKHYHEARGGAVVMVSHNMDEVARNASRLIVMNNGQIEMDGTPGEIFAHAERLKEIGLDVPPVTEVFIKLKEMGVTVDSFPYTIAQAKAKILELTGGRSNA